MSNTILYIPLSNVLRLCLYHPSSVCACLNVCNIGSRALRIIQCSLISWAWLQYIRIYIYVFSTCTRYWGKSFDDIIIDLFAVQLNFTAYSFSTSAIIIRTHTQALEQSAYFDFKVTESTIAWWIGSCVLQVFW